MKLALFACLMFATTTLCGGQLQTFVQFWLQFFPKWIPQDTGVDVMMLLDSSSSVQMSDFNKGKKGIQYTNLMIDFRTPTGINGQLNGTRSGYIQYASLANTAIEIHLPDFNNAFDLNAAIASQDYTGGGTAIAKALQLSGKEFFVLNDNPGQPRRVFLVTDGYETAGGFPVAVASYLKQIKGVQICVVGIGNLVKMNKLRAIATKYAFGDVLLPCTHNVKSLPAFKKGLRKAARFLRKGKRTGLRKAARFLRKGKRTGKGN